MNFCFAQDQSKVDEIEDNPILFTEILVGYAGGNTSGFSLGGELNYQQNNNLYSIRYINQTALDYEVALIGFVAIPFLESNLKVNEVSILLGKRYIKDGHSFSFSGGLSANNVLFKERINGVEVKKNKQFIGFPLEVNIKWFKKKKKRFRAYYGLIPVGKPSSFGRSFGFKLYGNVGKLSYVGLGINYGFGWHKKY
ncbi:hypothetical protein [Lacinutrix salivirga]